MHAPGSPPRSAGRHAVACGYCQMPDPAPDSPVPAPGAGSQRRLASRVPGLRAAEGRMRRLAGVLGEARQLRAAAAHGPAAQAGMAGAAAARPGVLRQFRAVLAAMTSGFDPATPNTARVYSRLLGGKDHFAPDRAEADVLLEIYPPLAEMVKENRAFIAKAVTWAAGQFIGQFIDLGAGLPAAPSVEHIARLTLPAAQVAYVDWDRCKSGCAHTGITFPPSA
jgi:hypothetical protein